MIALIRRTLCLSVAVFALNSFADAGRPDVGATMEAMGQQSKILGTGFAKGASAASLVPAANALAALVDQAGKEAPKQLTDGSATSAQQLIEYDAVIAKLKVQVGLMQEALNQGNVARAADIFNNDIRALQRMGHQEFKKD